MADSQPHSFVEAAQYRFGPGLSSLSRPDTQASQPRRTYNNRFWRTQRGPILPELLRAQQKFATALEDECDHVALTSGSSDHDDEGAIMKDLKRALPTLLQENSMFKERMYAQSEIEPGASPTADDVHQRIVHEQCRPRRNYISHLPPEPPSDLSKHPSVLLAKTPPCSPPVKLPHFSSRSTLTAEQAPIQTELLNRSGIKNIHILDSLRKKETMTDPAFTLPMPTRPRLPDTPSANEITFLLRSQTQRRRKQIHNERTGQSAFPGYERRAVRRRLGHVSLGKDQDVWPPSKAPPPALDYSDLDEEDVAILIASPTKRCPACEGPIAKEIPMMQDSAVRVVEFLRAQHTNQAMTAEDQKTPDQSSSRTVTTVDKKAEPGVISISSGRSLYIHANTQIDRISTNSTTMQSDPSPQHHKARAASIDIIEQFPAPVSVKREEEPIKRVSPPKVSIAGFEEHSERELKRKQRPESLGYPSIAHAVTKTLRAPLSPQSRNIMAKNSEDDSHHGDNAPRKPSFTVDSAVSSPVAFHNPPALDAPSRGDFCPIADTKWDAETRFSPAYSVPSRPSCIRSPTTLLSRKTQNDTRSFDSQFSAPIRQRAGPLRCHPPSPNRKHQHRRGPVVFTEEGLGKAMFYSSQKNTKGEDDDQESPSSDSMNSLKAKEYLRHLNEHVDNLCQERDQAVRTTSVLTDEVMRLKLTVTTLKRELDDWQI